MRRITRICALAAVTAAVVAPAGYSAGYVHSPGLNPYRYEAAFDAVYVHSPGIAAQPTAAPVSFVTDTLAPGGGSSSATVTASASSFSWGDAGIGAACVAALVLLVGLAKSARPAELRRVAL